MMMTMGRMPGVGLVKGLSITLRHMLRKSVTQQYPEVRPDLPPRSRGVIALVEENCTSCMLCARECPDWCIYIDSHKETIPAPEGGRPRQRNVLDRFAIDFSLCMYCGICVEVCPFDALFWSPEFEYAEGDILDLLHEKDKLSGWSQTVPIPPGHDPGAELPKELTAAPRRTPSSAGPAPSSGPRRAETPARGAASARTPTTEAGETAGTPPETAGGPISGEAGTARGETVSGETAGRPGAAGRPGVAGRPGTAGGDSGAVPSSPESAQPPVSGHPAAGATSEEGAEEPGAAGSPSGAARGEAGTEPGEGPSGPGRRPRRSMANIRGIRPPGALPPPAAPEAPLTGRPPTGEPPLEQPPTDRLSTGQQSAAPSSTGEEGGGPSGSSASPRRSAAEAAGTSPSAAQSEPPPSSTGEPSEEKLSTGGAEVRTEGHSAEQTSPASPRRRRMADPRSIRPPGRLAPDETKESEEES